MNCFLSYLSIGSHWALSVTYNGFQSHSIIEISGVLSTEQYLYIFGNSGEEISISSDSDFVLYDDGSFHISSDDSFEIIMEGIDSE